jgi:hypothetical protein
MRASLSPHAWQRLLGRGEFDRGQLQQFLAGLTLGERRAFWSAVLLMDDRATVDELIVGWDRLSIAPPDARVLPMTPGLCEVCGKPPADGA